MKKIKLLFVMLLILIFAGCKSIQPTFENTYKFTIQVDKHIFHTDNLKIEEHVLHFIDSSGIMYHVPTVNIDFIRENY